MTARQELDRLCNESWVLFGQELRGTGRCMGRIGLSSARRHPALLLGGGALLAFGATMWLTRDKRHKAREEALRSDHDGELEHGGDGAHLRADGGDGRARAARKKPQQDSAARHFAMGAVTKILKNAARMWLLQQLSSQIGAQEEDEDASDSDAEAESADRAASVHPFG
jgi:hypothetical protein